MQLCIDFEQHCCTVSSTFEPADLLRVKTFACGAHRMGTLRKNMRALHRRLKSDFYVDPNDLKQMFGLGKGDHMPALSLFAMTNADLNRSGGRKVRAHVVAAAS